MTKKCYDCKKDKSLNDIRPYGPNGEDVCFACAFKDEKTTIQTENKFKEILDGPNDTLLTDNGPIKI